MKFYKNKSIIKQKQNYHKTKTKAKTKTIIRFSTVTMNKRPTNKENIHDDDFAMNMSNILNYNQLTTNITTKTKQIVNLIEKTNNITTTTTTTTTTTNEIKENCLEERKNDDEEKILNNLSENLEEKQKYTRELSTDSLVLTSASYLICSTPPPLLPNGLQINETKLAETITTSKTNEMLASLSTTTKTSSTLSSTSLSLSTSLPLPLPLASTSSSPSPPLPPLPSFLTTMPVMNNKNLKKNIENKCTLRESFQVSYQKDLKPFTSIESSAPKQCKLQAQSEPELQVEQLNLKELEKELPFNENCLQTKEGDTFRKKDTNTDVENLEILFSLSLAERKAKLREDFFKNSFNCFDESIKTKLPDRFKLNSTKRLLWRNCKTKLKILKEENYSVLRQQEEATTTTTPIKIGKSLVEQRKLELARKFLETTKTKTAIKPNIEEDFAKTGSEVVSKKVNLSFPKVVELIQKFDSSAKIRLRKKMIQNMKIDDLQKMELKAKALDQRNSPLSDEGCTLGQSPYSSDNEDNESIRTTSTILEKNCNKRKDKVARSASSDSALGMEVEDTLDGGNLLPVPSKRRMTLTVTDLPLRPALLPLAEPTALPDSPTKDLHLNLGSNLLQQTAIPTKVLLEERVVEIPEDPRSQGSSLSSSRRESAQSCLSDYPNSECSGVRFVRTPSVVVSDYSDDVMCGITLEEIEYFRAQRMRRRRSSLDTSGTEKDNDAHSDVSASSSCSNLYYCGSTISALDGAECYVNGMRMPLERKTSDSSQYSFQSGDEDSFTIPEQPEETARNLNELLEAQHISANNQKRPKKSSGWRKIRNIVQWTPFFQTYKKQRYPWVQLAGHQGNFKAGPEQGTVLKKLCPKEEECFLILMNDLLRPYVPEYRGQVSSEDGELYLQLEDLLSDFNQPCVMDCKIGVRTYLEEELSKAKEKPKLRKDMYEKMIQIDPNAPNEDEHKAKGVTKPRYMVWRETISSTATLGFRIEGIKKNDGTSCREFKTTKSKIQIKVAFKEFIRGFEHALPRYIQRLKAIRATLELSDFFKTHEVIGSSLLFVHDSTHASVWLIDFAKTIHLPDNHRITHNQIWSVGNHEDGYLIGIENIIKIFEEVQKDLASSDQQQYQQQHQTVGMEELYPNAFKPDDAFQSTSHSTIYSKSHDHLDNETSSQIQMKSTEDDDPYKKVEFDPICQERLVDDREPSTSKPTNECFSSTTVPFFGPCAQPLKETPLDFPTMILTKKVNIQQPQEPSSELVTEPTKENLSEDEEERQRRLNFENVSKLVREAMSQKNNQK